MFSNACAVRGAAALALCAGAGSADAQVSISPTRIEIGPRHPVSSETLLNGSDFPILIQSSAFAWSQSEGREVRQPSSALIVAPAVAEIPPHAGQVFRIRLRDPLPASETAFRLILEDASPRRNGEVVAFRIRHDVPVLFDPDHAKGRAEVSACSAPRDQVCVRIADIGDRFLRVDHIELVGASWRIEPKSGGVVLAGAWRDWTVERPAGATGLAHVVVHTNAGTASADLTLDPN